MKKQETVVSYLQEEVMDLVLEPAALDEWHRMIGEMGLEGQQKTAVPDKSPIAYPFMTPSMVATFETLCPREVELKDYSAGPIPLKALELIKLAVQEKHFDRIMIRYDDKSPDPVAIGEKGYHYSYDTSYTKHTPEEAAQRRAAGKSVYFTPEQRYLIARWGAENKPLEELAMDAKKRWLREKKAEKTKQIKELQNELAVAEEDATIKFNC
jgi:hypothetical protein